MNLATLSGTVRGALLSIGILAMAASPMAAKRAAQDQLLAPFFHLYEQGNGNVTFTNSTSVHLKVITPANAINNTWCISETFPPRNCNFAGFSVAFTLSSGDGVHTVYARYKTSAGSVSTVGSATITLDTSPISLTLYSPAGIPGMTPWISYANGQFITGFVAGGCSGCNDPVTLSLMECQALDDCSPQETILGPQVPPFVWRWPANGMLPATTSFEIEAKNAAGTVQYTPGAPIFQMYTPNGSSEIQPVAGNYDFACVTASPSSQENICLSVADQSAGFPVGCGQGSNAPCTDAPSSGYTINVDGNPVMLAFSGYSDPSIRRDPALSASDPDAANLWMLYSFPKYNFSVGLHSGAVEIHLASSPDGSSWAPYSSPVIWPSIQNTTSTAWSSHEVVNMWPANNNWYAAHLMYYVMPGQTGGIPIGIDSTGCIITTVVGGTAASPAEPPGFAAGWPTSGQSSPPTCPNAGYICPNNNSDTQCPTPLFSASNSYGGTSYNYAIPFSLLTSEARLTSTCSTSGACIWGEPAIMVNGNTAYLALSAATPYGYTGTYTDFGYYIFQNSDLASLSNEWTYYAGPLTLSDVLAATPNSNFYNSNCAGATNQQPPALNHLTELDWAQRADGTYVAVATPAYVPSGGSSFLSAVQCGCVAFNLNLSQGAGSSLIGNVTATLGDFDPQQSGPSELPYGANGCTYEPTSNTGIVEVRRLMSTYLKANGEPAIAQQLYSLIETGVMP